jgi:class 3 adenylate cyclase/DNA-binding CsgD family transcriptional regulator
MDGGRILVVDDRPQNVRLMEAVLEPQGYVVRAADSGEKALDLVKTEAIDLVLLDILMPEMDGYEVCRRLRADEATASLPVVMVTSSGNQEKLAALEAGADDFIPKPFDRAELLARVRSLLRVKKYYDTVQRQATELAEWNQLLSTRVEEQVTEIQRLARLRRFLSPPLADLILSSGSETALASHRREIAVLFCDLRGFTPFAEAAEPEEVMTVLGQFHEIVGELVHSLEATVGYFAGDGLMVFFNDPMPCDEPALRAVRLAVALREEMTELTERWRKRGNNLDFGVAITFGYATLGEIGFEGRSDYGAIGSVVNLASRLCDEAKPGQVLISQSAYAAMDDLIDVEELPALTLKGFSRPVPAYNVVGLRRTSPVEGYLPAGLTLREAEVLRLLAGGSTSQGIADDLVLSVRTIERHIANVYRKIGAHGRADATVYAITHGIWSPNEES